MVAGDNECEHKIHYRVKADNVDKPSRIATHKQANAHTHAFTASHCLRPRQVMH